MSIEDLYLPADTLHWRYRCDVERCPASFVVRAGSQRAEGKAPPGWVMVCSLRENVMRHYCCPEHAKKGLDESVWVGREAKT